MSLSENVSKLSITPEFSLLEALQRMDNVSARLLIVMQDNKFISLLSIGDLQRAIIGNKSLDCSVSSVLRTNIEVAKVGDDYEKIKLYMLQTKTEYMPIIDDDSNIVDIIFWDDLFTQSIVHSTKLNLPVVIMAGGKGVRLRPLTNILPKPLLPIDNRTIVEHIINNFEVIGCSKFFMSINYKSKMIRQYFEMIAKKIDIEFFEEEMPLGTAGSLHLIKSKINSTFFISNCDILIEEDYAAIYKYHIEYENELTIVASLKSYSIPYGILETKDGGELKELVEKPDINFLINSGMYLLEPHLLNEIPENQFFHITDLIKKIQLRGGRVGVFPVSEKSWRDIGDWEKYLEVINLSKVANK